MQGDGSSGSSDSEDDGITVGDTIKDDTNKDDNIKDDNIKDDNIKDDNIKDDVTKDDITKDDITKDDITKDALDVVDCAQVTIDRRVLEGKKPPPARRNLSQSR